MEQSLTLWKTKNNIYHLIQSLCDRPAYFWFNYRNPFGKSLMESISVGVGPLIEQVLRTGVLDPQKWCDHN